MAFGWNGSVAGVDRLPVAPENNRSFDEIAKGETYHVIRLGCWVGTYQPIERLSHGNKRGIMGHSLWREYKRAASARPKIMIHSKVGCVCWIFISHSTHLNEGGCLGALFKTYPYLLSEYQPCTSTPLGTSAPCDLLVLDWPVFNCQYTTHDQLHLQ